MNITVQIPPPTVTLTSTPITTSYYAGTPLNLTCTVQLIPQVDTNVIFNSLWTGPGGQISSGVGRVSLSSGVNQTTVQFYPLNTTDTGVYNCSVSVSRSGQQYVDTSIAASSSITSITVKALPAPQVTITPSGSSTAGSPYNLTCTVMVVNGLVVVPQVMWFRNGTSVIGGNGILLTPGMLSANTTTLSLQFNPLHTSNGGQYSCTADVSLPAISITRLYALSSARVIIQTVPSQVVMEEDNITLTCHVRLDTSVWVDSTVMINIQWFEPGGARVNGTSAALVSSTYTNHTLRLPSVVLQESGVYTCLILVTSEYTTSANVNTSIEVAVYSISIVASSNTTLGGMNYSLTCTVDKYRSIVAPNVAWPLGSGMSLFYLTLFAPPMVEVPPPNVTITSTPITTSYYAGTPLNLTCTVQLIPQVDKPIIATWLRGASIITIDNYTIISPLIRAGSSSYVTTLNFNPLGTADSGWYNCNVSVQPGTPYVISGVGGGSLFLQVLALPAPNVTITPSLPSPSLGVAYSLTCQAMGVAGLVLPIALTWTRADGLSLGAIPVRTGSTITLSFPSWSALNLAQYNCTAAISLPYKGIMVSSTASIALKAPGVVSGPALATPSDSSSVINWSPPQLSNGRLTGYALSIVQLLDYGMPVNRSAINATVDVIMTSYNWSGLYSGVPYQTCISAVNPLGPGDPWCKVFFIKEEVPSVAPMGVVVTRSSDGLSMKISWSPLTLSQARGFMDYYAISYRPVGDSTRQLLKTTEAYIVVSLLNAMTSYLVTVGGHTAAGLGPTIPVTSSPLAGPSVAPGSSVVTRAIAGAVIGGILSVLLVVAVILIIMTLRSKRKGMLFIGINSLDTSIKKGKSHDMELTSINVTENVSYERPISVTSFHDHVHTKHMNGNKGFQSEYHQLSDVKPEGASQTVASLECNARKNRFGNIVPCDENRVKLKETPGVPGSDYINASHIDGYQHVDSYIASQGPKENTIADFWRMIWEKHIETIVMLTKCTEAGKNLCKQYWADEEGGVYDTDTLCITTTSVVTLVDYNIRRFEVKSKVVEDLDVLQVTHYQYTSWPDDEVPQFSTSFLNFVRRVQMVHDKSTGVPLLVHCSAGVGRTGTFIALDTLLDTMRSETSISVFEVVKDMRRRRVLMVQTLAQYVFIHDALDEYITCGDTSISVTNLRVSINFLSKTISGKTFNGYREQFSGYKQCKGYIATQGPLQNTVEDFWRMVWEFKCRVIIMLCPLTEKGHESSYCYWPTEEEMAVSYGSISVTLQSQLLYGGYEVRTINIRHKSEEQDTVVTQLHFTEWPENGRPPNTASMVELMDTLTRTQISTGNKPIVVHCNDGVGRTGTFITMHSELERLKAEGALDVFERVKLCRIARPGLVQNVDQYVYCHEFVAQNVN
eukprot:Em0011g1061a